MTFDQNQCSWLLDSLVGVFAAPHFPATQLSLPHRTFRWPQEPCNYAKHDRVECFTTVYASASADGSNQLTPFSTVEHFSSAWALSTSSSKRPGTTVHICGAWRNSQYHANRGKCSRQSCSRQSCVQFLLLTWIFIMQSTKQHWRQDRWSWYRLRALLSVTSHFGVALVESRNGFTHTAKSLCVPIMREHAENSHAPLASRCEVFHRQLFPVASASTDFGSCPRSIYGCHSAQEAYYC